jgi:hypothetical protein
LLQLLNHLPMILNHLFCELFYLRALGLLLSKLAQLDFALIHRQQATCEIRINCLALTSGAGRLATEIRRM